MNRRRRRGCLALIVGMTLWLPACAAAQSTERARGERYAAEYATTKFKPFWWYYWTGINVAHTAASPVTGRGSRVAIVDTGVLFDHEDLASAKLEPGVEFCSGRGGRAGDTRNGHGTELAGIVVGPLDGNATRGVAPDATVIPYKVVCGTTNAAVVHQGVQMAVNTTPKPHVVLLALGPWPGDTNASGSGLDELLDPIVSANSDTLFVVGSVWDLKYYPRPDWTLRKNVILVAAMTLDETQKFELPYNAKRGDIYAPGRDVETASIEPTPLPPGQWTHDRYKMQGTSAAAAIVAGCAALIKQATGHTGMQLRQDVIDASEEAGLPDGKRLKCSKKVP